MWRSVDVAMAVALVAAVAPVRAINLSLTTADIDRALVIARGRDAERAGFHAPYIVTLNDPFVQSLEIITEFRRVVLIAEDHIRKGDRGFAYSSRLAQEAVVTWKNRVSVVARLKFHPLNTYVAIPKIDLTVDGPNADEALVGVLKEPVLAIPSVAPGEHVPLFGAIAEGVFDAKLIGQTQRKVTVRLDGKTLVTASLDFRAVE